MMGYQGKNNEALCSDAKNALWSIEHTIIYASISNPESIGKLKMLIHVQEILWDYGLQQGSSALRRNKEELARMEEFDMSIDDIYNKRKEIAAESYELEFKKAKALRQFKSIIKDFEPKRNKK